MKSAVQQATDHKGPVIVEFMVEPDENVYPMIPPGQSSAELIEEPSKIEQILR